MGKEKIKEAKAEMKAERQAKRKAKRTKFLKVAKHYFIAGAIVLAGLGLYQLRVISYNQGYNRGVKDGKDYTSEIDATVIERTIELKKLIK